MKMKYDIDAFYKNMQNILEEREISYKEVYTAIGMQQSNFSNAYNRRNGKAFTLAQMLAIAEFLDCSLDALFTSEYYADGEKYIKIPEMSKWTCADLLRLIFALRKSGSEMQFVNTRASFPPFFSETDVTAIYFAKKFNLHDILSFMGSNTEMLINSAMREWSKILESTENIDDESRELMLSTWETKKLEQFKNMILSDDLVEYKMDENSKRYVRCVSDFK